MHRKLQEKNTQSKRRMQLTAEKKSTRKKSFEKMMFGCFGNQETKKRQFPNMEETRKESEKKTDCKQEC